MAALFDLRFQETEAPYANSGIASGSWDVTTEYGTRAPWRDAEGLHFASGQPRSGPYHDGPAQDATYALVGSASVEPPALTIQFWLRVDDAYPGTQELLAKANQPRPISIWDARLAFVIEIEQGWWMDYANDPAILVNGARIKYLDMAVRVPLHQWHLFTITNTGEGRAETYLDGVLRSSTDTGSIDYSGHGDWILGGALALDYSQYVPRGARPDCTLGSLEVHDVVLTPEQVAASYAAGQPTFPVVAEPAPAPVADGPYKKYQRNTRPPWLLQPAGEAWSDGTAAIKDECVVDVIAAVKERMPCFASWDALDKLGTERQIYRGRADTDAEHAARLLAAWGTWAWAGSSRGILSALWDLGYRGMRVVSVNGTDASLEDAGAIVMGQWGSWSTDATLAFWSKFQVLFAYPHPWVSTGMPSTGSAEVTRLLRLVHDMAPGFATFAGIVVHTTAGQLWGWPRRTWGEGGTWNNGGASVLW
jgi:hypothetical protein